MVITEYLVFFFFQAEDGIRYDLVTGVQTCALPISGPRSRATSRGAKTRAAFWASCRPPRGPQVGPGSYGVPAFSRSLAVLSPCIPRSGACLVLTLAHLN